MPRRKSTIVIPSLGAIDRRTGSIGQQIAEGLRRAIAGGELKAGEVLPSTRTLAASLEVARGTVVEAYDQLQAEGYIQSLSRVGTTVVRGLVKRDPTAGHGDKIPMGALEVMLPKSAAWLEEVARTFAPQRSLPFAIALPTGAAGPDDKWRKIGNKVRATRAAAPAGYADPRGLPELREAIADYLRRARSARCDAENVVITSGTQQGLYLAARVLVPEKGAAWAEDPGYWGITTVLSDLAIPTTRVPVDDQGISVQLGIAACPDACVAFVTPSHQYPLGMPMSMARRTALLSWARSNHSWIVEDDYDSELRYAGHPFPCLQGLDPQRVIYMGTLSKVLFPSLRLGYAVMPQPLVDLFAGARALVDRHSATIEQHVLAAYMRKGLFEAHIRRIRGVYSERRMVLISAIEREMSSLVVLQPSNHGMHVVLWLPPGLDDVAVARQALVADVVVRPVSTMYSAAPARSGLMLGFGGFTPDQIGAAVKRLRAVLEAAQEARPV